MEDKHIWYFLFYAYNKEKGRSFSYLSKVLWHKPMTEDSCESCSLKYPTWELAIIKSRSRCKFQSSPRRSATCSLGPDAVPVILCITLAESLLAHNSLLHSNGKESEHQAHLFCIISCLWYSQILCTHLLWKIWLLFSISNETGLSDVLSAILCRGEMF